MLVESVAKVESDQQGCAAAAPPARRPEAERVAAASPPDVVRGVELHGLPVAVVPGIDWFRSTGLDRDRDQLAALCTGWWGKPEERYGRHRYKHALHWANGAEIWYGGEQQQGKMTLELPGGVLAEWDGVERLAHVKELAKWAPVCRRIDVAVDVYSTTGKPVGLLDAIDEAVAAGAVCYARTATPTRSEVYTSGKRAGQVKGRSGYLGSRRSSERFVNYYDKGLETGERPAGQWERWESRFAGDAAMAVWAWLIRPHGKVTVKMPFPDGAVVECDSAALVGSIGEIEGMPDDDAHRLIAAALGVVDFRAPSRGKSRSLKRRAELGWWTEFLKSLSWHRVKVAGRGKSTLDRFRRALQRQYWPTVRALVKESQGDVSQVEEVLGMLDGGFDRGNQAVIDSYRRLRAG